MTTQTLTFNTYLITEYQLQRNKNAEYKRMSSAWQTNWSSCTHIYRVAQESYVIISRSVRWIGRLVTVIGTVKSCCGRQIGYLSNFPTLWCGQTVTRIRQWILNRRQPSTSSRPMLKNPREGMVLSALSVLNDMVRKFKSKLFCVAYEFGHKNEYSFAISPNTRCCQNIVCYNYFLLYY